MKFTKHNLRLVSILGSLFALSCSYSNKIQARMVKKTPKLSSLNIASKPKAPATNRSIELKSTDELKHHLSSGKPAVLMIHASWCGACKASMNPFQESAEDNPQVTFLKAEGSKDVPDILKEYTIRGYPTFILFDRYGKEKHKFSGGGWPKSVLNQKIKQHLL